MMHQGNNQPEDNDPLKEAYQRLQEARNKYRNSNPLDELTTRSEELKAAEEAFEVVLQHAQKTDTIPVDRHSIWKREFESLVSLAKLNGIGIDKVLEGIQEAENGRITQADFSGLGLTDISPLTQLTQLTKLGLGDNRIQDISSLAPLTPIFRNNEIQDISPFTHLTQLRELGLENNKIQDISPLAHLPQLKSLRLQDNQIQATKENKDTFKKLDQRTPGHRGTFHSAHLLKKTYHFLNERLEQRTSIFEGHNPAENNDQKTNSITVGQHILLKREFEVLESLAKLNETAIDKVLGGIKTTENGRITYADFSSIGLTDISPIAQLTKLTTLGLGDNYIADISPLIHLTQLMWLGLQKNQIQDIAPLAQLTHLTWLNLGENQIYDISPLAQLTELTTLGLGENQIYDISPLAQLTQLTILGLDINQIQDISPLTQLTQLTKLWLGDNYIDDISPLSQLTQLTWLYLHNNQIQDISPLAQLTNLTTLRL